MKRLDYDWSWRDRLIPPWIKIILYFAACEHLIEFTIDSLPCCILLYVNKDQTTDVWKFEFIRERVRIFIL